jgi:O-acetyl-ADP-ribose deacetylase (regulator of RNase III)
MITYRTGDLFASGLPAIAHGVNCQGVMGAGIAAQFRRRWPDMYEAYRKQCGQFGGLIPGDVIPWKHPGGVIFNLATQLDPGADAQPWMITAAVGRMIREAHYSYGITEIGLPMIGCGFGGLHRDDLYSALAPYRAAPVNLVVFSYEPA